MLTCTSTTVRRSHGPRRPYRGYGPPEGLVAASSIAVSRLWHRLCRPAQRQFCSAADESGSALQRHRLWTGWRSVLPELCAVRSTLEPVAAALRRPPLDCADHAHVGSGGRGHDVRED